MIERKMLYLYHNVGDLYEKWWVPPHFSSCRATSWRVENGKWRPEQKGKPLEDMLYLPFSILLDREE
jgi:hypothetical protein